MKIKLLNAAKYDLKDIRDYIAQYNPQAARAIAAKIKKSFKLLGENPYIGHPTDDEDVLEWHMPGSIYTFPYIIMGDEIVILRVFHENQQRPGRWERGE